jgi:tetratricopeptide (TPR) repeat protein
VASNPRIDDLRRRLEREPNSRLFAQLAEELRKDGEFEEAIRIARAGLARHPNYPSARMTLGRALFDTGDMAAARHELQSVLEGAPDNILASRLLAECLESLGDLPGALQRFRATLALSPGDKQITARVRGLEAKLPASATAPASPTASPPATAHTASPAAEPAPIPVAAVDEPMELEVSSERSAPVSAAPPPAEAAPAEFELERPYEAPGAGWQSPAVAVPPASPSEPAPPAGTVELGERTLIDEQPPVAAPPYTAEPAPTSEPAYVPAASHVPEEAHPPHALPAHEQTIAAMPPAVAAPEPPLEPPAMVVEPEPAPAAASPAPVTGGDELVSPTLAELYLNQGFREKALEVYRRLLEKDPANDRARARLAELERPAPVSAPPATAASPDLEQARQARRQALERTIERLESLRAALQKGAR